MDSAAGPVADGSRDRLTKLETKRVGARVSEGAEKGGGGEPLDSVRPDLGLAARAALLAWAIPGVGHLYLGRRRLALVYAAIVFSALTIGWSLEGNLHQVVADRPLSILATLGSMGLGLPYFFLRYIVGYSGNIVASGFEYGSAFVLTAGLMNLLLALDCWDISRGRKA